MNRLIYRKYISLVIVMAIFTVSVSGFCPGEIAASSAIAAEYRNDGDGCDQHWKGSHACPVDEHSIPGHCDSNCDCPCHAQLTADLFQIICSRQVVPLDIHEPFRALPEVYLPRFVPPHIHA